MQLVILLAELFALYLFSRWVTTSLYAFFFLLLRSRSMSVSIVTLLLFPGTVIHELAHLFTAEIMGVHTGKLTLAPDLPAGRQESIRGPDVQTGSVAIVKTDPLRRALIGLAPLFIGIVALIAISYFINQQFNNETIVTIGLYYLLFSISNAMFPSSTDMKGVWPLAIVILLCVAAASFAGIRLSLSGQALEVVMKVITSLTDHLKIVLALNGVGLLVFQVLIVAVRKLHR